MKEEQWEISHIVREPKSLTGTEWQEWAYVIKPETGEVKKIPVDTTNWVKSEGTV